MGAFHEGERRMQAAAGVRDQADRVANGIHATIPDAAREFLRHLPFVILGAADTSGRLWASLRHGRPGFLEAVGTSALRIDAPAIPGDPLESLSPRAPVGVLAIEPATRRRMRLNGSTQPASGGGLRVEAREVYANCPKYIQKRETLADHADRAPSPARRGTLLTERQRRWIAGADTFFIASAHPDAGADASHRGGNPGFVEVIDERTLRWPDYPGNRMFNTLGNLLVNPSAGLLFVDFETGDSLQLTGVAAVLDGEPRTVSFRIDEAVEIAGATPLRLALTEYSPFNPLQAIERG